MSIIKKIQKKFNLIYHSGNRYYCPFCGYKSRDLKIVGHDMPILIKKEVIGGGKRAAGCYKCESRDRERLLYLFFMKELKIYKNKNINILHIAPEPKFSKVMQKQSFQEYICGDLFSKGYNYADYVINMNILNTSYDDNHFDYVICNHVLEHIPEDIKAIKEIWRILKPDGKAILQVPISKNTQLTHEDLTIEDPHKRKELFGQFDHIRIYGQDYTERLKSVGFQVNRINISNKYKKFGVNPDEDLFFCEKK